MSIVARGSLFDGYGIASLETEFERRRKSANQHFGVPDYVANLKKDLQTTRERIVTWPRDQPDRVRLDRERIARLKHSLDYYGHVEPSDSRDFYVFTPEEHKPSPGGFHVPGSNYIGPGTSDLTAEVKTVADSVARKHDIAYNQAKTDAEVRQADRTAIGEFIDSARSDPIRGYIGAAGIGIKYGAESLIGVQYGGGTAPDSNRTGTFTNKDLELAIKDKASHSSTYMDTPPASAEKRQSSSQPGGTIPQRLRLDNEPGASGTQSTSTSESASAPSVEMAETAAGGAATTFGTAGDNEGPVFIGQGHVPSTTRIYTKKFQLETMGFNPVTINANTLWPGLYTAANRQAASKALSTPVAGVDPNLLPWYMTKAEFDNLSDYSIAESCRMTVRPLGYRIPFATNQSISENANSSATLVQVLFGQGLNHKFDGSLGKITAASTNPALPTLFTHEGIDLSSLLYAGDWAACLGTAPFYNQYYAVNKFATPTLTDPQSPMLLKALTLVNIADVRGEPLASVEHKFKCAPLKWENSVQDSSSLYHPGRSNAYYISSNKDPATFPPNTLVPPRDYTDDAGHLFLDLEISSGDTFTYKHQIEKANYMAWRPEGEFNSIPPPHLNFGCMPLRSDVPVSTGTNTVTCLPVTVIWELSTELTVREIHEFPLPDRSCPWTNRLLLQVPRGFGVSMLNTDEILPYYQGGSVARLYPLGKVGPNHNRIKAIGKSDEGTFSSLSGDPTNNTLARQDRDTQEDNQTPLTPGQLPKRRRPVSMETVP